MLIARPPSARCSRSPLGGQDAERMARHSLVDSLPAKNSNRNDVVGAASWVSAMQGRRARLQPDATGATEDAVAAQGGATAQGFIWFEF